MQWSKMYDAFLEADWRAKGETRQQDVFHASEIGFCQRKAIFRRSSIRLMPDAGRLRRFRQGTVVHSDYALALTESMAEAVRVEVSIDAGLPPGWAGTCDAVYILEDGEIADFKTVNANAFRYSSELPKPADCLQLGAYWYAYERQEKVSIAGGKIVYIPLGAMDDPIECQVSPHWKEEALRVMAAFDQSWSEYLSDEVLPEMPGPELKAKGWQQSWECNVAYCDYKAQGYCAGGPSQP